MSRSNESGTCSYSPIVRGCQSFRRVLANRSRPRGVADEVTVLISALAHVGHRDTVLARKHFVESVLPLKLDGHQVHLLDIKQCTLTRLKTVLATLSTCSMPIKKRILDAAALCVAADGTITVGEAELLRAVADSLDCPIPPILPGKLKR